MKVLIVIVILQIKLLRSSSIFIGEIFNFLKKINSIKNAQQSAFNLKE